MFKYAGYNDIRPERTFTLKQEVDKQSVFLGVNIIRNAN
jgi:hypothetical protein